MVMTEVYRFRSAKRLLDESLRCQELERQTIYFADPAELNDPVEAMRGVFWRGDSIAWTNFFKNYVFCVHRAYLDCLIGGPELDLQKSGVWVDGRWDQPESPSMGKLFDEIWTQVRSECRVGELAKQIGALQRDVRRHEMLVYLYGVHLRAFASVAIAYADRGLASEPGSALRSLALDTPIFPIAEVEGLVAQAAPGKKVHEQLHEILINTLDTRLLVNRYIGRRDSGDLTGVAKRHLMYEFPRLYLRHLPELMGPTRHTASFCNTYHSPAMWANYADNHQGVCLVFETDMTGEDRMIRLHTETQSQTNADRNGQINGSPLVFEDVDYADRLPEVDFFRSLGQVPEPVAMKLWYTDDEGNVSSCASFLQDPSRLDVWRKDHWNDYNRAALTKTEHWAHEEETRLFQYGLEDGSSDLNSKLMRYDFESLKGIIFGINMSEEHKMQVIEIVERKCQRASGSHFEMWQAYYSPQHGDIQRG